MSFITWTCCTVRTMKWPFKDSVILPAVLGNVLHAAVRVLNQQPVDSVISPIPSKHRTGNLGMECD